MGKITMNIKEAAEELGVCVPKVRELVQRQDFPAMKIGKTWKISRSGLYEWVEKMTKERAEL